MSDSAPRTRATALGVRCCHSIVSRFAPSGPPEADLPSHTQKKTFVETGTGLSCVLQSRHQRRQREQQSMGTVAIHDNQAAQGTWTACSQKLFSSPCSLACTSRTEGYSHSRQRVVVHVGVTLSCRTLWNCSKIDALVL